MATKEDGSATQTPGKRAVVVSPELEALLRGQQELHGRIARAVENLKKMGASKITAGAIDSKLKLLDNYWAKFENAHEALRNDHWPSMIECDYTRNDFFGLVEEAYVDQRAALLEAREEIRRDNERSEMSSVVQGSQSKRKLPQLQLPSFAGRFEDWPNFKDRFESVIAQDASLSNVDKLHYLRSCLKGDAEQLVKNIATTGENYSRVWKLLSDNYANKRLLLRSVLANFLALPKLKNESAADLRRLYHGMLQTVGSLEGIGRPIAECDLFLHIVVEALDVKSRREWETAEGNSVEPSSYERLKEFLERRLRALDALQVSGVERGSAAGKTGAGARAARSLLVCDKPRPSQCSLCQGAHYVLSCKEFQKRTPRERRELARKNDLCTNCFGKHRLDACPSTKTCVTCHRRHHSSIHEVFAAEEAALPRIAPHFSPSEPFRISALILPRVSGSGGGLARIAEKWPHVRGLRLADPDFDVCQTVEVLLGAEVYANIVREGLRRGGPDVPVAVNTTLGWILAGAVRDSSSGLVGSVFTCTTDDDLGSLVARFWQQEEPARGPPPMSAEEKECEAHFVRTHSRTASGRYVVRLPVREPLPNLEDSERVARRTLAGVERRLAGNERLYKLYSDFMKEFLTLGHMAPVPSAAGQSGGRVCYLPHHGVMKGEGPAAKIRVVFNGSARISNGVTLNELLRCGPNLLPALADILTRWRRHKFAATTDVAKMYRQVLIHEDDHDLQRVLWRGSPGEPVQTFRLRTVTYGLACAPFLAVRTMRQLAIDEGARFPQGADALLRETYVDDVLTGADSLGAAREKLRELSAICEAGGFPLRKWAASDGKLLETIPREHRLDGAVEWSPEDTLSALGLRWHPLRDAFRFRVPSSDTRPPTKRRVLSESARLYDPLGWLAPVTVSAKLMIQTLWLRGVAWDDALDAGDAAAWMAFRAELPLLEAVELPRWLRTSASRPSIRLHGFSDASERAYAAVVYLQVDEEKKNSGGRVTLLGAKTRVAPLRRVSLPRLELCGAALLAEVVEHFRALLDLPTSAVHLWTDSTVALAWIRGHPAKWTTYVANRVAEIQRNFPGDHWRHLRGVDNPADCASRGVRPRELVEHPLWWTGPPWLRDGAPPGEEKQTTMTGMELEEAARERRAGTALTAAVVEESEILLRFSRLNHLLRFTARCLRWRRRASGGIVVPGTLTAGELEEAETLWTRAVQGLWFAEEVEDIRTGAPLPRRSDLLRLTPFLDERGVLRVGGRVRHALVPLDQRHPVILPRDSGWTRLLVDACHRRVLHGGVQLTLAVLRQRYWVLCGRSVVKRLIHGCVRCARWRAAHPQPLMGDLPRERVRPSRPFLHTGIDYAGPVWMRCSRGRGQKSFRGFLAIFVCFATRAVHLEAVSDYSADAFLAAYRRFVSRRGLCATMWSDRGTTFVGADAQLRAFLRGIERESPWTNRLANDGVAWRFNPPGAPHFGGLWEAAVRSTKHHLRRVIGETSLTFEELTTLLSEVEACLNSRPLAPLSDDPDDVEALTPGHFLIGAALNSVPEARLDCIPEADLTRWRVLQRMRDHFWRRWAAEVLQTMAARPKWLRRAENVRVGTLCLIRGENTPPTRWPLARVVDVHPGADGQVRVVSVRTATSTFKRPVVKIVPLFATSCTGEAVKDRGATREETDPGKLVCT
ncbi:uncharacterized protein [Cardiocondyla obscurior]|uniref:uncharacterized protein n=1 Tax=Cardiocondyla obscurior TaxID=286306 RepID=UPI00396587D1